MQDISSIERFIDKQKVSFIASVDEDGFPNVKAMLRPRKHAGLKEFWFSTNTSSMRVKQFRNNPKACIYFYHKGLIKYVGVMLTGTMEVLTDQESKDMIWKRGDTLFYNDIGRTNLPFGSPDEIMASLDYITQLLPDETILYPGHGKKTTIGYEKTCNPFVKVSSF